MVIVELPDFPAETVRFVAAKVKVLDELPTVNVKLPVEDA